MANQKAKETSELIRQNVVESILELMEQDGLRWIQGFNPEMFLAKNELTPTKYRGVNRVYLASWMRINHMQDPRFCTFTQAKKQGWKVKKGSHALKVELWKRVPFVWDENGARRRYLNESEVADMRLQGKEPKWQLCLASCIPVFNYDDIDGPEAYLPEANPSELDSVIAQLVASSRCPVHVAAEDAACYIPMKDEIVMPPRAAYDDASVYAATLAHEMAHSTKVPLERVQSKNQEEYAIEELRAELASVFVCVELDIPLEGLVMESHAAYLKSWISVCKEDGNVMLNAITDAQKIADYLLDRYRKVDIVSSTSAA